MKRSILIALVVIVFVMLLVVATKALEQAGKGLEEHHAINPIIGYFEGRKEPGLWVRFMTGWLNDWRALVAMVDAAPELTLTEEQLHRISAPVYCIVGENDPFIPSARALKKELPHTTLFIVPSATHMTAPRKQAAHDKLRAFLEGEQSTDRTD